MSNGTTGLLWLGLVALLISSMVAVPQGLFPGFGSTAFLIVSLSAPFAFMAFQTRGWFSLNKKIVVCVTHDGLTVDRWPGDTFHSATSSWAYGRVRCTAAQRPGRRCTCDVARTALFSGT
jgi:hypothetical protein